MQIVQMIKRGKQYLLARVVDEEALNDPYIKAKFKLGEVYEYVACYDFDGKEWNYGSYYTYNNLQGALDKFNRGYRITYARMSELATRFKDALLETDEEYAMECFREECDMSDDEYEYFGIEHEVEEEEEPEYDMSEVDEYYYGIR